ncbi:methyltransferase [Fluviispira multicolorata]|uniref:Methyltransferase n=1 Tax=Fluviispira multicolorata TaxID=2654512 RepID=A0A833JAW1_9BACT|nr:methyltransferase [Fluviispira multicolorata]KAB8027770.1 methyltransferase [Fluviispira multicolorata]
MQKSQQNFFDIYSSTDELKIHGMLSASLNSKCIQIGVKYGIFSLIHSGTENTKDLAKKLGFIPDRLYRVLKNLEHLTVIKETNEHCFKLTALGEKLLPDSKGSLANLTMLWSDEFQNATNNLDNTLKIEKSGFEIAYNDNLYSYLQKNPKIAENFDLAMRGLSEYFNNEIPNEMDLKSVESIADIGGGSGATLRNIIAHHSHLKGILFDQKSVIDKAMNEMEHFQHKNRVDLVHGDFFKPLPFKVDCIIMSNIIHNWSDEKATQILLNCRNALNENGKIYLVEAALEGSIEPIMGRSMDLTMLLMTSGKERTFNEFDKVFHSAGLKRVNAKNILNMTCLIEVKSI